MDAPITTERLVLRRFRDDDRAPFAAVNADPEVMAHFPTALSREESDGFVDRILADFDRQGYGLYALEVRAGGTFVGFTGLARPRFEAPFVPAVEIGWRLARAAWGRGYASEAANAVLAVGFERVGLEEIVSFTSTRNERSQAVMRRIGMRHDPAGDFDHPAIAEGSPLRRHVLYRLDAERWRAGTRGR